MDTIQQLAKELSGLDKGKFGRRKIPQDLKLRILQARSSYKQSLEKFCRALGIRASTFHQWKKVTAILGIQIAPLKSSPSKVRWSQAKRH